MNIEDAISSYLSNYSALAGIPIYRVVIHPNAKGKVIRWAQTAYTRETYTMEGVAAQNKGVFSFDCWDTTYEGAREVARSLREALESFKTLDVIKCFIADGRDVYDWQARQFGCEYDVEVWYNE